jgi:hypothetical protein
LHELWALLNFLLPDLFSSSEEFDAVFSGKCWAAGSELIMSNGQTKKVEEIKAGDLLLGEFIHHYSVFLSFYCLINMQ